MTKKAVLLALDDETFRVRHQELNAIARRVGGDVEFSLVDATLPLDEVVKRCQGAIALTLGAYKVVNRPLVTAIASRIPGLKLVQAPSAGTDSVDKVALAKLGIQVCNAGGANAVAVSEHAIALMFSVYRKFDRQIDSVKARTWQGPVIALPETEFHTLVGKRIGIVGLGRIGSRVARRLQGWECEVVYHDILDFPAAYVEATHARRVDFETLLETSDVVTLHVPLEPTTRHMMSDRQFARMKPTAILINTCRGPVVDEAALIRALRSKKIFGAGLDVVEDEPIARDNPLPEMDNVIVTPHLATRAIQSTINSKNFVVENISRLARGEAIESVVPPIEE